MQLLSAAHLVLLFISFMILPNETGYLLIIVGETVLAFACYRVYRQACGCTRVLPLLASSPRLVRTARSAKDTHDND